MTQLPPSLRRREPAVLTLPRIPAPLRAIAAFLPQHPHAFALAALLNLLARDAFALDETTRLHDKVVMLHVADAGLRVAVRISARGYVACSPSAKADVAVTADARDFVLLALGKVDADTLFFDRRLTITGDTEVGLIVKSALERIVVPLPARLLQLLRDHLA